MGLRWLLLLDGEKERKEDTEMPSSVVAEKLCQEALLSVKSDLVFSVFNMCREWLAENGRSAIGPDPLS